MLKFIFQLPACFFIIRPCLVSTQKLFIPSHRMFGHMYGALNIDKKTNCTVYMETAR
jgi:hypothetical protein